MKILLISTSVVPLQRLRYGGIEKLLLDFAEGLLEVGHDVTVAAPIGSVVPKGVELIETVKLPEEQDRDDIALAHIKNHYSLTTQTPDVVHDFSHKHELSKLHPDGFPVISMFWHPMTHRYNQSHYNAICLSKWQADRMFSLYNQKSLVMPMCVDSKVYHPIDNPMGERFLFLGKISESKGVHLAIQYCREMGVALDVIGGLIPSETNSPYLQEIEGLCDGEQIKLHFNVTEEEKIKFLQNAKAMIYPNLQDEAHWLAGIEAWMCNCPTIAYERGSFSEIHMGFNAKNEKMFKDAMRVDVWSGSFADEAGPLYSRENVIPKYLELYKQVAKGRRW